MIKSRRKCALSDFRNFCNEYFGAHFDPYCWLPENVEAAVSVEKCVIEGKNTVRFALERKGGRSTICQTAGIFGLARNESWRNVLMVQHRQVQVKNTISEMERQLKSLVFRQDFPDLFLFETYDREMIRFRNGKTFSGCVMGEIPKFRKPDMIVIDDDMPYRWGDIRGKHPILNEVPVIYSSLRTPKGYLSLMVDHVMEKESQKGMKEFFMAERRRRV